MHAPITRGLTINRYLGTVCLYALPSAAAVVPEHERKQAFSIVDESPRFVGRNVGLLLMQLRSMKASLWLSYQSSLDMRSRGYDAGKAIETNAGLEWIFSATTVEEQRRLVELSGETVEIERSATYMRPKVVAGGRRKSRTTYTEYSTHRNASSSQVRYQPGGEFQSARETLVPRLNVNEISAASSDPLSSIVRVRQGDTLGLPFLITHFRHVDLAQHERDKRVPWPPAGGRRIAVADESGRGDQPPPDDTAPEVHHPGQKPRR